MANMSTSRPALGDLSLNIIRGKELTVKMRGKILGMHEAGHGIPYIIVRLKQSRSACRTTIDQDELRNDAFSIPRPGGKKSFTHLDERNILRHARTFPKHTYNQLQKDTGVTCSHRTISRILKSHGILNWRCAKRPHLTKNAVKKRYE
jgi:hypothetical protein